MRFNILDQNQLVMPGKCVGCGTSQGKFLDIGLELDFYGVVYICIENCMTEVANGMEYYTQKQWKLVTGSNSELRTENNKLKDENEELRDALDCLGKFANNSNSSSRNNTLDQLPLFEEPQEPNGKSESDNSEYTTGEKRPVEQINVGRSADLQFNDNSLDDFFSDI